MKKLIFPGKHFEDILKSTCRNAQFYITWDSWMRAVYWISFAHMPSPQPQQRQELRIKESQIRPGVVFTKYGRLNVIHTEMI